MASTGEVAAFGSDVQEAYWASLLSVNGMKLPRKNSGVLIGGDITKPEMASIARSLSDLGFNLYCSSKEIEQFIATLPYVRKAKRVEFPLKDKRRLHQVFEDHEIQMVINLAKTRGRDVLDEDYVARRNAVDFGILMSVGFYASNASRPA